MMAGIRSIVAVAGGLFAISAISEGVEFALVTYANGGPILDPSEAERYFAIRNQLPILVSKFVYNGFAALAGGYVAVMIAQRHATVHGVALAVVQAAFLAWGMLWSAHAGKTPAWVWMGLIPLMSAATVMGARMRARHARGVVT
ncbi:MAG: hypothetical protein HC850_10020 [Rhodomicrobium sp.]|nr:hypothetical protein [Rhodomicrobium sp.]